MSIGLRHRLATLVGRRSAPRATDAVHRRLGDRGARAPPRTARSPLPREATRRFKSPVAVIRGVEARPDGRVRLRAATAPSTRRSSRCSSSSPRIDATTAQRHRDHRAAAQRPSFLPMTPHVNPVDRKGMNAGLSRRCQRNADAACARCGAHNRSSLRRTSSSTFTAAISTRTFGRTAIGFAAETRRRTPPDSSSCSRSGSTTSSSATSIASTEPPADQLSSQALVTRQDGARRRSRAGAASWRQPTSRRSSRDLSTCSAQLGMLAAQAAAACAHPSGSPGAGQRIAADSDGVFFSAVRARHAGEERADRRPHHGLPRPSDGRRACARSTAS